MTATTFEHRGVTPPSALRRLAPSEGWLAVGLVILMCLTLAWAIDDSAWVLGRHGLTSFLPWAITLGAAWGVVSARAGMARWIAHLLGACLAALIVSTIVGYELLEGAGGPIDWFTATASSVVEAYLDLVVRHLAFTTQIGHFLLVLGMLCWATGQFAAYAVFHHRRPLNAAVAVGIGLVLNMSVTRQEQLPFLVVFTVAALFLLIRTHAQDEQSQWLRKRVGDASALGSLYLRGGTVFVAIAVLAALMLTASANSAPLASLWTGVDRHLVDVGRQLQRIFRAGGPGTRLVAVDFGTTAPITGTWTTDNTPVLRIQVPDDGHYYWRAVTYDHFDGRTWSITTPTATTVPAGDAVLTGTADDPTNLLARRKVSFSVTELAFDPSSVFSPDAIVSVSKTARLTTAGATEGERFSLLEADASSYGVTALVPIDGSLDPEKGLTANKLRVAGTEYPADLAALYATIDPSITGPATRALLREIMTRHPEANQDPYDMARAVTTYLSTSEGRFHYEADVSGVDCGNDGVVECFANNRVGYCEYYASTMVVLMRMVGVPARLAEGFLPGERSASGVETIRKSGSHAWVEVYFPRYGWVTFDPTGGSIGQDQPLPAGPTVAPPSGPLPTGQVRDSGDPRPGRNGQSSRPGTGAGGTTDGSAGSGPLVLIGLLLLIGMAGLVLIARRRGPRPGPEPESVYRGIVGLARRFGFAARPSQTAYEYADALGNLLPRARPDLQFVANAKVEVVYGRRTLAPDRLRQLRAAQRRLRVALIGLIFRRGDRRRQRARRG